MRHRYVDDSRCALPRKMVKRSAGIDPQVLPRQNQDSRHRTNKTRKDNCTPSHDRSDMINLVEFAELMLNECDRRDAK